MQTSLIHIGDFHAAPGPRNADRYQALEQILVHGQELAHEGRLGAWLWPGDLFDALSTTDDRNELDLHLVAMAEFAPVCIVYGNHDRPGDLDGFARLKGKHRIVVVSRPQTFPLQLATGETASIFALPYPTKAGLVAAGVIPADVVDTAGDLLEPVFMVAAAELEAARQRGELTLMIGHVNVAGSQTSTGQPNIGHEIELNPRHLDRLGDIPKLLNHIHKPQMIAGAHYAGSVCRLNYGEIEEKRFLVVTFDRVGVSIKSVLLDVPPMFHIEGELRPNGFFADAQDNDFAENEVDRRCEAGDWEGCDVRVRYRYKASEKSVLSEQGIRDIFEGALRLKVESIAEPDRELRAPEVAAARTLPEKLAAYRRESALPVSVAEKLALLEQEPDLPSAVAARIKTLEQGEEVAVAA